MIRATYGHSIEIELDLPTDEIPEALYWPCEPTEADAIVQLGNYLRYSKPHSSLQDHRQRLGSRTRSNRSTCHHRG